MKNKKGLIISVALILVGLIGALCVAIPSASEEYQIVEAYVDALDSCDFEAVKECFPLKELSSMLGSEGLDMMEDWSAAATDKLGFLRSSGLDASDLVPEDAKSVEDIRLVSVSFRAESSQGFGAMISGGVAKAFVEVTYINAADEEKTVVSEETISLLTTNDGPKIITV